MNTANLDLNTNRTFQRNTQRIDEYQPTRQKQPHRKKVKVSLRKKDTSARDKKLGIALIVLIVGLFVGALGFTLYHMAKGPSSESAAVGYYQQ